jgi:hypothetical protein
MILLALFTLNIRNNLKILCDRAYGLFAAAAAVHNDVALVAIYIYMNEDDCVCIHPSTYAFLIIPNCSRVSPAHTHTHTPKQAANTFMQDHNRNLIPYEE